LKFDLKYAISYTCRMSKEKVKQNIINFKVDDDDLAFIDAKAKRYGLSRSAMIKYFALNGEFTTRMEEQLKHPKL